MQERERRTKRWVDTCRLIGGWILGRDTEKHTETERKKETQREIESQREIHTQTEQERQRHGKRE